MKKVDYYNFFCIYTKMSEETFYQKHRDVILNRAKDYYENDKERLRKQVKKYRELSEKEKIYKDRIREKQLS